jgi:peptidyl-prolyl cis-trans isomerase SurA
VSRTLLGSSGLLLAALLARPARAEMVDRVAAVVNNEIVTLSAVQKRAVFEFQRLDAEAPADRQKKREEITRRTLDAIIDETRS